jgi:two-component system cell cycle sensor histidine kinase PleC
MKSDHQTEVERLTRLNPWTLRFQNSNFEAQFQKSWINATRTININWSVAAILFYVLYTIGLASWIPTDQQHHMELRYFLAIPAIILGFCPFYFSKILQWALGYLYFLGASIASVIAFAQFEEHIFPYSSAFLLELITIFTFCQHYNRILFTWSASYSLFIATIVIAFHVFEDNHGIPFFILASTAMAMTLTGIFASYTREVFIRRNYASMWALRQEKEHSEQLAREALAANEAKSRFLAVVSHELRTPLNAVIGYTEMLQKGLSGALGSSKSQEYLEHVHFSGILLRQQVNDILDISRAVHGTLHLQESSVDISEVINMCVANFRMKLDEQSLGLSVDVQDDLNWLFADSRLVRQMVNNLVANGAKFSEPGDEIRIAVSGSVGEGANLSVSDTGIGIPETALQRIFEPFVQLDDGLDRLNDGLGLGLPLTRELIEAHDGAIDIQSEIGIGTTVSLWFPPERVLVEP